MNLFRPVRIALVGLDHWYSALPFAESVAAHGEAELAGLADADLDRARSVARSVGAERVTADPGELIGDESVDVVVSFVSVERNPGVCIAAARQGKHILSIKPLARTLEEATDILTAVREAGVVFLPAESRMRLAEQYRRIKGWISEGRLGRLLTADFSLWSGMPRRWHDDPDPGWFADPRRTAGGGWIDHGIYHVDLLRWLLDTEVAQVSGRAGNLKHAKLPVEDYGSATVEFEGGLVAKLEDTWLAAPGGGRTSMSLVGTEGALVHDTLSGRLSVAGEFPPFDGWVHTTPRDMGSDGLDHLLSCVRDGERPVATVGDAWRNLATCRAFYDAVDTGKNAVPAGLSEG